MEHTAQPMIQVVTNDLLGLHSHECLSNGDNALRTQRVLDAALNSYYGGREIGFWTRVQSSPKIS